MVPQADSFHSEENCTRVVGVSSLGAWVGNGQDALNRLPEKTGAAQPTFLLYYDFFTLKEVDSGLPLLACRFGPRFWSDYLVDLTIWSN